MYINGSVSIVVIIVAIAEAKKQVFPVEHSHLQCKTATLETFRKFNKALQISRQLLTTL